MPILAKPVGLDALSIDASIPAPGCRRCRSRLHPQRKVLTKKYLMSSVLVNAYRLAFNPQARKLGRSDLRPASRTDFTAAWRRRAGGRRSDADHARSRCRPEDRPQYGAARL